MAKIGREESQRRAERQRARLCKEAGDEPKASGPKPKDRVRQRTARILLREDEWHEEEADFREDSERPKLPD